MKSKTVEQLAKERAFEFQVDYKPWEENLSYNQYVEYGFEKGFISGFSRRKEIEQKIITDTLNKYRSWLSSEQTPKLGRTANYEKEVSYKAYIEILEELKNKLKICG